MLVQPFDFQGASAYGVQVAVQHHHPVLVVVAFVLVVSLVVLWRLGKDEMQ